jgi:hypothetical protein
MIAPTNVVAYHTQGFGDVKAGASLLKLGPFKNLNIERAELTAISNPEFVRGDRHQRASTLTPAGHNHSKAITIVVSQAPCDPVATVRITTVCGQKYRRTAVFLMVPQ